MKKIISILCLLLALTIGASPVMAASKTVDASKYLFKSSNTASMRKLAKKVKKMKTKSSSKYPSLYLKGNKVTIGVCENASARSSRNEYLRITNEGNKNLTIYKLKINDTKSVVKKKMKAAYFTYTNLDGTGKAYWFGESSCIKVKYNKKGKLKKWTYISAPTS